MTSSQLVASSQLSRVKYSELNNSEMNNSEVNKSRWCSGVSGVSSFGLSSKEFRRKVVESWE